MGPIFHEKIPNYGSDFQNFPGFAIKPHKIWCAFVAKSQEMGTFLRKKSLNMGACFLEKLPLNMSMGLELPAAQP